MKRRILSALMALAMVAGLMTGCSAPAAGDNSSSEGTSQAELAPVSKDEIKVGFVYISDSSDMGYTYNHELGTKEMQEALACVTIRSSASTMFPRVLSAIPLCGSWLNRAATSSSQPASAMRTMSRK